MTVSKEPLGPAVAHNEIILPDPEKDPRIDSVAIQHDQGQFEGRGMNFRTILAIVVRALDRQVFTVLC